MSRPICVTQLLGTTAFVQACHFQHTLQIEIKEQAVNSMNEFKAQMPREFVLATFTMSATDHVPQQVQLDKALANASFANWQLGRGAMVGQQPASLPSPPAYQTSYGNGFLRTRTALLQNNLHELDSGELVFFLRCDAGNGIRLHRIAQRDESLVLEDSGPYVSE